MASKTVSVNFVQDLNEELLKIKGTFKGTVNLRLCCISVLIEFTVLSFKRPKNSQNPVP